MSRQLKAIAAIGTGVGLYSLLFLPFSLAFNAIGGCICIFLLGLLSETPDDD